MVDISYCLSPIHHAFRENRYLLFLMENYSALEILRHYLNDVVCSSPPHSVTATVPDNSETSDSAAATVPGSDDSGTSDSAAATVPGNDDSGTSDSAAATVPGNDDSGTSDSAAATFRGVDDSGERRLEKMKPFILFGSSFPKDKEYTQVGVWEHVHGALP